MSFFKHLVEQASSTIPFEQAKPYKQFNDYKEFEAKQKIIEQRERERELEDTQGSNKIEGLSSRKRVTQSKEKSKPQFLDENVDIKSSIKKNKKTDVLKKKKKTRPSFMDEGLTDIDDIFPKKVVQKANGILSKICQKSESKQSEKDIENVPESK